MLKKGRPGLVKSECRGFLFPVCSLCCFYAATAAGTVALAVISKKLIDIALKSESGNFSAWAAALLAVAAAEILLGYIGARIRARTSVRLEAGLKRRLLRVYPGKSFASPENIHSEEFVTRFYGDTGTFASGFTGLPPAAVSALIRLLLASLVLISFNYKFSVLIPCLAAISVFSGRFYVRRQKKLYAEIRESDGKINAFAQEFAKNIPLVKTAPGTSALYDAAESKLKKNYALRLKRFDMSNLANTLTSALFTAGYYAALVLGATKLGGGALSYGTLVAMLQLFAQIRSPIIKISEIVPAAASARTAASRLEEINRLPNEIADNGEDEEKSPNGFSELRGENIEFSYARKPVLRGGSFTVKKGGFTAVTGASGEGKTTLIEIMLGLLSPAAGKFYFKTEDGEISVGAGTRSLFAYVPQENSVFSMTVRENLLIANRAANDETITSALKTACVYDEVASLPRGLETELGEHGLGLSHGQLQRLSIARALLTDAPVLLLDEATSALDEAAERAVLSNLKSLKGKTVIISTHKPAAAEICDNVINIKNGFITDTPSRSRNFTVSSSRNCSPKRRF